MAIGDGADAGAAIGSLLDFFSECGPFAEAVFGGAVLSYVVFSLLRELPMRKRKIYSRLLFIAPVLCVIVFRLAVSMSGAPDHHVFDESTTRPVVLAGATFPAGSSAEYVTLGHGFWRRKLIEATSARPVKFGSLEITDLKLDEVYDGIASVQLVGAGNIDGWPCGKTANLKLMPERPRLLQCKLGSSKVIGNVNWPANTDVTHTDEDDWSVDWAGLIKSDDPSAYPQAFGFPAVSMDASYNASLGIEMWQGTAPDVDVKVGDYTFRGAPSTDAVTHMTWQPPDAIRIEGRGKDNRTGADVYCVLVHIQGRTSQPCEKENE